MRTTPCTEEVSSEESLPDTCSSSTVRAVVVRCLVIINLLCLYKNDKERNSVTVCVRTFLEERI